MTIDESPINNKFIGAFNVLDILNFNKFLTFELMHTVPYQRMINYKMHDNKNLIPIFWLVNMYQEKVRPTQLLFHIILKKLRVRIYRLQRIISMVLTTGLICYSHRWLNPCMIRFMRDVHFVIALYSISSTHFTCINDNNCILPNAVVIHYKLDVMTVRRCTSDNFV
jgi:hypothetical protein